MKTTGVLFADETGNYDGTYIPDPAANQNQVTALKNDV